MLSPEISELFPQHLAAIVRWHDKEQAAEAALVAAEAGIGSVEITAGTPDAFELIRHLRSDPRASGCAIGAGTLTDGELARRAVDAGAQYLVTPYLVPAVADVAAHTGIPLVMGALTPTEIARALELGAQLVKVFPVAPVGGPAYIRALRGPMPDPAIWVSGGARIEDCEEYLRAGTDVVGLTNDLFRPELLMAEDWGGLTALCEVALAAARRAEPLRTTATV
jgi:2-dehydro-3-deoxyphosphogluconate aldolase/(4S)-4-hydroxy-2-oxoglutarate aldolase